MERAKVFIFAGLGAVTAMVIYGAAATKRASSDDHKNRLARIEALMNEGEVQYRPSFFRKHHESREKIAGLETTKTVTEIAPPKAPVKDTKAEDAKKAAEKKAADEKKKKEDEAKKKKKKKKKEEAAPGTPAADANKPSDDDKKKDDTADAGGSGGGLSALPISPNGSQDPNKLPQTVDEWIAYLFTNPSSEKTSKFIQLAQVGSVTTDIFFPVVEKMLVGEGRMPEFGVMSLGSLPSSQSFQLLADVANEQALDDKIKLQAQQYMNLYTRIQYVRYLGAAAGSSDSLAANDAINLIQRSLQNLRTLVASQPTTATARTPASSIPKIYQQIETALTSVSTTSADGSVRSNAKLTASAIAQVLQTVDSQAAVASPSTPPTI